MALTVTLALCVAIPAVASAHVTWATNYIPVAKSTPMEWNGKLKIASTIPYSLECTDKAEGVIGANGVGEVTKLTTSSCKNLNGCPAPNAITAVNLPWHTELVWVEGKLKNVLTSGGKGNPGFKTECTVVIKVVEECTASTLSTTATNGESGVTAAFNSSEKLNCTGGGVGSGTAEGSQTVTASGGTLSAQKEEPVWLKNGSPLEGAARSINWGKGKMTLYVNRWSAALGVSCEDSAHGTAEVGGVGSVTKLTFSNCKAAAYSQCTGGPYSLEAKHLPWNTQLYFGSGGAVGESFVDSGAGAPGITVKCHYNTLEAAEECTAFHLSHLTNNTEGVLGEMG